ncbi:MAG: chemotaxis protein CheW [Paracoccus denitrificans]|nr:MAG: chemotaxis protein CheW [Paracoccus denitrificans]PZO84057.1 MAG: chemotaxis protein CheW [Paracoccus denitrificans]
MNTIEPTPETELLAFRLSAQEFCIDIMSVREIRGWSQVTPLPFAPSHVKGMINLRGTVLPVIDLSARLGMPPIPGNDRNVIIVVTRDEQLTGLLVEAVSDILSVAVTDLRPTPEVHDGGHTKFVRAIALVDDRLIRLLDVDEVLPDQAGQAA